MITGYLIHIMIIMCIYSILSLSLNLVVGYTGLINFGHIAFFAIGAYTSALLTQAGVPFVFAFVLSGLFAAVFGYFLARATARLGGEYLAMTTLGFGFVISSVLLNWAGLTNGALGVLGIQKPTILWFTISSNIGYLVLCLSIATVSYFTLNKITKSKFGLRLQALRDDETRLRSFGENTSALKSKSLAIGAFFAGIAGSLFAHYMTYIDPNQFMLSEIVLVFTIVIVGGLVSLKGTLLATIIILALPEVLRFISIPGAILGPVRNIIYGCLLLCILLFKPRGLFGRIEL